MGLIIKLFKLNIPLLVSGFYFLGEFLWLALVLRDNIAFVFLVPIALIPLVLFLKKINFLVLGLVINFLLLASSSLISNIFNSLCLIYECYDRGISEKIIPILFLAGIMIEIFLDLKWIKFGNSTLSKLLETVVKIITVYLMYVLSTAIFYLFAFALAF